MTFNSEIIKKTNWIVLHHGRDLEPLYNRLVLELIANDTPGHWDSWRGGNNSNFIRMDDGRTFYLRGNQSNHSIEIRHRAKGPVVLTLSTRMEVKRWVESLTP